MLLQSTVGAFKARLVLRPLFCNEILPWAAYCCILTLLSRILFFYCRLLVVNGLAFIFYQKDGELLLCGRREIFPFTILAFQLSLSYDSLTFISFVLLSPLDDRIFSCLCLSGDPFRFSLLKPFAILMFVTTPTSPLRTFEFYYFLNRPFYVTSILSVLFKNELIFY